MHTYRVLIVDDQRDVRRVLRAGLETLGHDIKVIDVPSGEEAILVISRQPIDLLVSDVRLPGISGLELKERAQVRNPNLRFILITGLLDARTRQAVADAGADAYFFKPVEMTPFCNAALACLGLDDEEEALVEEVPAEQILEPLPQLKRVQPAEQVFVQGAEKTVSGGLAEHLSSLLQEVNAACVVLANDSAQVIAQAGALPEGANSPDLLLTVIAAFNAGNQVTSLLRGSQPQDWLYFAGQEHDCFVTSISPSVGLVVLVPHAPLQGQRVADLIGAMHRAGQHLPRNLPDALAASDGSSSAPVVQQAQGPEEGETSDELLSTLDAIFGSAKSDKMKSEEVDAFWESAVEDVARGASSPDTLSYEQARQLGLAPEEN